MTAPDFTGLPLTGVVTTLLFLAALDTIVAYIYAFMNNNFSWEYALDFLKSHVLKIGVPILGLALVGRGIPEVDVPGIPAAGLAATASLALYAVATVASIKGTVDDKAPAPLH